MTVTVDHVIWGVVALCLGANLLAVKLADRHDRRRDAASSRHDRNDTEASQEDA